jgi:hypothetical protein
MRLQFSLAHIPKAVNAPEPIEMPVDAFSLNSPNLKSFPKGQELRKMEARNKEGTHETFNARIAKAAS